MYLCRPGPWIETAVRHKACWLGAITLGAPSRCPIRAQRRRCSKAQKQRRLVKHSSTRSLYAHWNERRGSHPAPDRAEIEPSAIRTALGDSFILGSAPGGEHTFRLAGTR